MIDKHRIKRITMHFLVMGWVLVTQHQLHFHYHLQGILREVKGL